MALPRNPDRDRDRDRERDRDRAALAARLSALEERVRALETGRVGAGDGRVARAPPRRVAVKRCAGCGLPLRRRAGRCAACGRPLDLTPGRPEGR